MGIFDFISGGKKVDLIRQLLIERIQNDETARKAGFTEFAVKQLSEAQLLGSTEAAIVVIVETYSALGRQGVSEIDAINRIEAHRMALGHGPGGPPANLSGFVHYRVALEHQGPALPESHVDVCIEAADHFFTNSDDKGDAANSLKYAKLFALARTHASVMNAITDYFEGETTEDEFIGLVEVAVWAWSAARNQTEKDHARGEFLTLFSSIRHG